MGLFNNNIAKSFFHYGLEFGHHESGEEIMLVGTKVIKNRSKGLYLYYSYDVTIQGGLFAENTLYNIDVRWTDNLKIQDTIVRGYTPETKALVKPPYFNKPCISTYYDSPTGLRMPTEIHNWDRENKIGATLTNVLFTNFDHSDECETSIPFRFNAGDNRHNHFDYVTMLSNVVIDGTQMMDSLSSDQDGVKDVVLHDIDGSSDPLGQASRGMFVRNVKGLTAFAENSCIMYPQGISYCADSCYRTVSFMVDQSISEEFDLQITRQTDGETAILPSTYKYDDDIHTKHYSESYRFFSVSLPMGLYQVEFLNDLQPTWPAFVLPRWEGIPTCDGYVSAANITIIEPTLSCDEIIVNGDMEQGLRQWFHRNDRSGTSRGGLEAVEGAGVNNSTALKHFNRYYSWSGIGQNLDTRCLHQNLNKFYEIELYFRLEEEGTAFKCNPFSSSSSVRCPEVKFRHDKFVGEELKTEYTSDRAKAVISNDQGAFNMIHGAFKVDESIHALDRLFMYISSVDDKFDIFIDNVSVRNLPVVCGEDLVRNGNFNEGGKFWRDYGSAHMDIETSPNKHLKVFNKESADDGAYQDLLIDMSCFEKNQRFQITGELYF